VVGLEIACTGVACSLDAQARVIMQQILTDM
jgi:hypothetical protein